MGGDLGIGIKALSLGSAFSYSESVTNTLGQGASPDCPEGAWRCGLLIVPSMMQVKGTMRRQDNDESCPDGRVASNEGGEDGKPFEVLIPLKDQSGNGKWTYNLCTCQNVDGKDDEGHPEDKCLEDCTEEEE